MLHEDAPLGQIHVPYNWVFATPAEMAAYAFTGADAGKLALVTSDNSMHMVRSDLSTVKVIGFPTAQEIGAEPLGTAVAAITAHVAEDDPHPVYTQALAAHTARANPHGTGITDIAGLQAALDGKAATVHFHNQGEITGLVAALASKANVIDVYVKTAVDALLAGKADTTAVYTQTQVDSALALKANVADVYTAAQVDAGLAAKANTADVYTKAETDSRIQAVVDAAPAALDTLNELAAALGNDPNFASTITTQLAAKANSADVYTIAQVDSGLALKADAADVYTKTQVDTELAGKANVTHAHAIGDVTGLVTALAGKSDTSHTHTPASIGAESAGTAAALVAAHEAAADPHAQYLTQAEADALYGGGSSELRSILATSFTNNTTTLSASGLSVTLAPNTHYEIECTLLVRSAATTTGVGIGFNGPAGYVHAAFQSLLPTSTTAVAGIAGEGWLDNIVTTAAPYANANFIVSVRGMVVTGATGGALTVYLRSEVAGSAVTIMDHSVLKARPL